jgi:hypothetical protein
MLTPEGVPAQQSPSSTLSAPPGSSLLDPHHSLFPSHALMNQLHLVIDDIESAVGTDSTITSLALAHATSRMSLIELKLRQHEADDIETMRKLLETKEKALKDMKAEQDQIKAQAYDDAIKIKDLEYAKKAVSKEYSELRDTHTTLALQCTNLEKEKSRLVDEKKTLQRDFDELEAANDEWIRVEERARLDKDKIKERINGKKRRADALKGTSFDVGGDQGLGMGGHGQVQAQGSAGNRSRGNAGNGDGNVGAGGSVLSIDRALKTRTTTGATSSGDGSNSHAKTTGTSADRAAPARDKQA